MTRLTGFQALYLYAQNPARLVSGSTVSGLRPTSEAPREQFDRELGPSAASNPARITGLEPRGEVSASLRGNPLQQTDPASLAVSMTLNNLAHMNQDQATRVCRTIGRAPVSVQQDFVRRLLTAGRFSEFGRQDRRTLGLELLSPYLVQLDPDAVARALNSSSHDVTAANVNTSYSLLTSVQDERLATHIAAAAARCVCAGNNYGFSESWHEIHSYHPALKAAICARIADYFYVDNNDEGAIKSLFESHASIGQYLTDAQLEDVLSEAYDEAELAVLSAQTARWPSAYQFQALRVRRAALGLPPTPESPEPREIFGRGRMVE